MFSTCGHANMTLDYAAFVFALYWCFQVGFGSVDDSCYATQSKELVRQNYHLQIAICISGSPKLSLVHNIKL